MPRVGGGVACVGAPRNEDRGERGGDRGAGEKRLVRAGGAAVRDTEKRGNQADVPTDEAGQGEGTVDGESVVWGRIT